MNFFLSNSISFLTFITALLILKEQRTAGTCQFVFPFEDKGPIVSNGRDMIQLEFGLTPDCNMSTSTFVFTVGKNNESPSCLVVHKNGVCKSNENDKCQCPRTGNSLYHLEISPDPMNNGKWVWSSVPPVVETDSVDILITVQDDKSAIQATTDHLSDRSTDVSDYSETLIYTTDSTISSSTHPPTDEQIEPPFLLSSQGLPILVFNCVVLVAVLSLIVVVMKRRRRRLHNSLQRDISLQDLQGRQQLPLPEIPGLNEVQSRTRPAFLGTRGSLGRRRYRSQESSIYETVDDDSDGNYTEVRSSVSAPDLCTSYLPSDYFHPIPSEQEAGEARANNPHYENRPMYQNYFYS